MNAPSPLFEDTIAALATPPGRGAVALVRVSGRDAGSIMLRLCTSLDGSLPAAREQRLLVVRHPGTGEILDRALVTWFPAPASYTGEDTVEISTHGGTLGPQLVLDAALAAGARSAEPGEFTRRALINGKLDLLQAEAVADLVDARSVALRRAAIHQMDRGLSARVQELRELVLRLEALVAYDIDFPDEDEPPVPFQQVREAALATLHRINELLATAPHGEMLREGALVVLAGRPNSGKSSLFNALLGVERAIVTSVPGTTRDAIEGAVLLGGYPFRLVDTAGIRESEDTVERLGIEVARRYLDAADIILFCVDHERELDRDEQAFLRSAGATRVLLLRTMADLRGPGQAGGGPEGGTADPMPTSAVDPAHAELAVSALTGAGLSEVREWLVASAFGGAREAAEQPLVTRSRHARALREARDQVALFLDALKDDVPPELATTHLRAAATALELLVGPVSPDDVLGEIFRSFCVGK